ncbi:MAG TPA: M28 family metallopeptidase [Allosphingosinicella sp.]|jgi:Zn-dependent M28 family amino/carboxypeptidase|uniref:M28 family metallopeptidase n=1 Tax=Allosphingosinicella sp. TaxID=2823234 RepID=UPI002F2947CF
MRLIPAAALAALSLASLGQAQPQSQAAEPAFTPEGFRAHVEFLSHDLLEGRDTGTRGYDIAARYVATRFQSLGLKPGAGDSWYQQVPFALANLGSEAPRVTIGGRTFTHGQEVLVGPTALEANQSVEGPVVFVGYGLDSPANGFNDYRGLDVRGKIVATLSGVPMGTPSEMGAHLNAEKGRMAEKNGAIGTITIPTRADHERRPWARRVELSKGPSMNWIGQDGRAFSRAPGIRTGATLDTAAAEALFAGSRRSLSAILDEAALEGGKPKGFTLKPTVKIERQSEISRISSPNVLAVMPGSDPQLANEYVVLMAHLDHEGVDPDLQGDKIYNGAMDNATGTATLLEVARAMAASGTRPKRSILFAAVTAEEDGLLGSEYLARHPVVGNGKVVGVVNLDMPVLLYDFQDVIAFGADHSTLGPIVARAVGQANVKLSPDPLPQENLFTRSDHYRFVQAGVPSVFLMTGFGAEGGAKFRDFLATHYHKPSDQTDLPFDWNAAAKFARINYLIANEIANAPEAPRWYADSFFGQAVGGSQPRATRAR